jgi:large subunit ribosomal protein L21
MYAIMETGGLQFNVKEGEKLKVPKIEGKSGEKVSFEKVLLISKDGEAMIGTPYLSGAKIEAEVLEQGKGEKAIVYKFKKRVKYRRKTGHRQDFTEIEIKTINSPKG